MDRMDRTPGTRSLSDEELSQKLVEFRARLDDVDVEYEKKAQGITARIRNMQADTKNERVKMVGDRLIRMMKEAVDENRGGAGQHGTVG